MYGFDEVGDDQSTDCVMENDLSLLRGMKHIWIDRSIPKINK